MCTFYVWFIICAAAFGGVKNTRQKMSRSFYIKLMDKNICMHTALKCIFLHGDFYKPI